MGTLFLVVLDYEDKSVSERIEQTYPLNHYKINSITYVISSNEISDKIAHNIGLKGDNRIETSSGVVFRLNGAYAGYSYKPLWEWLEQNSQKG